MNFDQRSSCGNCASELDERNGYLYCFACQSYWTDKTLRLVHPFRKTPPKGSRFSYVWEPNGTSHNDLLLRIDSWCQRSDSYYFALDADSDRSKPKQPIESIRLMIKQWGEAVRTLTSNEVAYLPHDFSDQGTGWIRCDLKTDGQTELVAGLSSKEGWSFYPSDYAVVDFESLGFEPLPEFKPVAISRNDLLVDIDKSARALSAT